MREQDGQFAIIVVVDFSNAMVDEERDDIELKRTGEAGFDCDELKA